MLTKADGGGSGGPGTTDFGCHVICEQPLMFMDSLSVGTSCSFSELIVNNNDDVDDDDGVVGEVDGAAA